MSRFLCLFPAVILLLALSCQSRQHLNSEDPLSNRSYEIITADTPFLDLDELTKTNFSFADARFLWASGDKVGIVSENGSQLCFPIQDEDDGKTSAHFDGRGWALLSSTHYLAYYPFIADYDLNYQAVPVSYAGQEQSGNNSYAFGNNNTVSGDNTFVLGNNVSTGAKNAVVLGDGSEGVDDAVSVGAKGKERQIKNVAPGTDDSDATTVKQVKEMIEAGGGGADLAPVNRRIDNLDSKVNKIGAGAAALAALHPMDTDGKFSMAAGFGNYRDANAMALGVFYRPNDQVMFSMGGSLGNGENLLNVGVSFALDKGVSTSKAAMARTIKAQGEEIQSLRAENAKLAERLAAIEKISEQDAKIQTLEAENAKLAERLAAIEAKLAK